MKTFEEFWKSIPNGEFERISDSINAQTEKIRTETENPENLLGNQIAMISACFTREIVKLYHNWLAEQLGLTLDD